VYLSWRCCRAGGHGRGAHTDTGTQGPAARWKGMRPLVRRLALADRSDPKFGALTVLVWARVRRLAAVARWPPTGPANWRSSAIAGKSGS
jgi:hypothetical protein